MANTAQSKKRARQAEHRRLHNASIRSMMRTQVKKVAKAVQEGRADEARALYAAAVPVIDRVARKGLIHQNKAARHKRRLSEKLKALA